jgi:signal transduction histidine kinase
VAGLRSPVRTADAPAGRPAAPDYQRLFEKMPASCLVLDADLVILAINDGMLRDTMSQRADVVGRALFEIFPADPEDTDATGPRAVRESLDRVRRSLAADSVPVHRYDLPGPGGRYTVRYWSTVIEPVLGPDSELLAIIVMTQNVTDCVQFRELHQARGELRTQQMAAEIAAVRDIAERKRVDAMLAERTRELEISNRDLLQFASVASHDLQEPLRKVASFCQLLARRYQGQLDEEADEYIGFVVDGATRMQQLINDLLALARVGRSKDQMTDVDCGKVMRRVRRDMATIIEEAGAGLVVSGELPVVFAHQGLLTQLFTNLVANAVKFRGPRPPRVEVWASREPGEWRFAVKDNGIGIEPQYASRVFDVFERLHTRSEYPGTGIGLALCRKIVELHRGRIWLESEPGAGTTFYWTMPTGGRRR